MRRRFSPTTRHGTENAYKNYGCRCRSCKNAYAAWYDSYMRVRAADAECRIVGCDDGVYSRELCKPHYERQRRGLPLIVPVLKRPGARGLFSTKQR